MTKEDYINIFNSKDKIRLMYEYYVHKYNNAIHGRFVSFTEFIHFMNMFNIPIVENIINKDLCEEFGLMELTKADNNIILVNK